MNAYLTDNVAITNIYDHYECKPGLETGWGFSCLVEINGTTILFDTGEDEKILLSNMEKLQIDSREIEIIFLSHNHRDHTGGLFQLLKMNSNVVVYLPESFPQDFKRRIKTSKAKLRVVRDPLRICSGVYSTGELGSTAKEQSLIVKTDNGLVVITGCSHPGVVVIAGESMKIGKDNIYLFMGGFHLFSLSSEVVAWTADCLKNLGVKKVAPSHCTGLGEAMDIFKSKYGENFIENGVGKVIVIGHEMSGVLSTPRRGNHGHSQVALEILAG